MRQKAVIAFATSVHWVPWNTKDTEMGHYVSKSPDVIGFLKSAVLPFFPRDLCSTCFEMLISDQFYSVCWPCVMCKWNSFRLHVNWVDSAQMNISASSWRTKFGCGSSRLSSESLMNNQKVGGSGSSSRVEVAVAQYKVGASIKQQTTVELEGPHPQPVQSVWHATLRKSRVHNLECQDLEPTKTPDTWPNVLLARYSDESQHPRWYVGLMNPILETAHHQNLGKLTLLGLLAPPPPHHMVT